mgnify:CR=1 FL=1
MNWTKNIIEELEGWKAMIEFTCINCNHKYNKRNGNVDERMCDNCMGQVYAFDNALLMIYKLNKKLNKLTK